MLSISIGTFLTSQIDSFNTPYYTWLYKNEQFESRIIQWRLLQPFMLLISKYSLICTKDLTISVGEEEKDSKLGLPTQPKNQPLTQQEESQTEKLYFVQGNGSLADWAATLSGLCPGMSLLPLLVISIHS